MATYLFSHYDINGIPTFDRETTIIMDEDVDVVAHYFVEGQEVSAVIKNEQSTEQIVVVRTVVVTEEEHPIPAGDQVTVAFDPRNSIIVLKDPSA